MYANLERWPATPSEGDNERAERAPRIVLMGSRRSGKTSMARVVFGKMSPHETLFVPSTAQPTLRLVANSDLVHFSIFDVPGDRDLSELRWRDAQMTPRDLFGRCVVLAYVVDAEADPYSECARLAEVAAAAKAANPRVQLEVFVHKVDGDHFLSEEQKLDCRREVEACARAELAELYAHGSDENVDPQQAQAYADDCLAGAAFSLTSIYDHSVFEAFSKLVSRALVPQRIVLRKMLDALVTACDMEKSFLFDVASKVYVATDSAPVDSASYELCADAIDVVLDVASIYAPDKTQQQEPSDGEEPTREEEPKQTRSNAASIQLSNGMALVLDEVDRNLALVCLLRTENLEKRDLVDYNLGCFRTALARLAALNASSAGK